MKEICRFATRVKTENLKCAYKIPQHKQRQINRLLHILKLYNKENPENQLSMKNENGVKALFLEKNKELNIFKSEEELDRLLELNRGVLTVNAEENEDKSGRKPSENEAVLNSSIFSHLEIEELTAQFADFLDKCFINKLNLKKQNEEAQKEKEKFMKDIVTLYYCRKFLKTFAEIDLSYIYSIFRNKKFFSIKIFNDISRKEECIIEILQGNDAEKKKRINQIERSLPPTLESVSENALKQKNYGIKRITDFRNFCRTSASESRIQEEIVRLI